MRNIILRQGVMKMSSLYQPDSWQLVHVIPKDTSAAYYRILAGWSGSYMYGSSWKLSSGCEQVFDLGDSWKVPQSSGSVYILRKTSEHPSLATAGVLESIVQSNHDEFNIVMMKDTLKDI